MVCIELACAGLQLMPTYRLGWKAMPLARDDLDSNCANSVLERLNFIHMPDWQRAQQKLTFVSIFGEDEAILKVGGRGIEA
jgi:hypothetical protein